MSEGTNSRVGAARKHLRVIAMGQIGNAPVVVGDKHTGEDFVRFGRHNLFPEFCRGLADNCAPLDACIETMAQYIAGDGFEFLGLDEKPITAAYNKWEELCGESGPELLLESTALDVALMNTHSWELAYNSLSTPAAIHHMDVTRVRSGKKNEQGIVTKFFFSSNWERYKQAEYKPKEITAWGERDKKVLMYRRGYKQLRDYYGEPHWLAVMADAEVLTRIPVFNRTQIDTGFRPGVHLHLETDQDDADTEEIDEKFELAYMGDTGKTHIVTVGSTGEKLTITKLERGDHAGELDKTRAVSKEEIYHSYGIPPVLMGVDINTGMSGKGLAIEETLSMFQTMRVAPKQKPICYSAKLILRACGIEVPIVRIKQRVPFQPAKDPVLGRQAYIGTVKVNEYREANGMLPLTDERGEMLICEALKGAGNLDPALPDA